MKKSEAMERAVMDFGGSGYRLLTEEHYEVLFHDEGDAPSPRGLPVVVEVMGDGYRLLSDEETLLLLDTLG